MTNRYIVTLLLIFILPSILLLQKDKIYIQQFDVVVDASYAIWDSNNIDIYTDSDVIMIGSIAPAPIVHNMFLSKLVSFLDSIGLRYINIFIISLLYLYYIITLRKNGVSLSKDTILHKFYPAKTGMIYDDEVVLDGLQDSDIEKLTSVNTQNNISLSESKGIKYKSISWLVLIVYICLLFFYGRNEPMELYVTLGIMMIAVFLIAILVQAIHLIVRKKKPKQMITVALGVSVVVAVIGSFVYFPINRLSSTAIHLMLGLPIVLIGHLLYLNFIDKSNKIA